MTCYGTGKITRDLQIGDVVYWDGYHLQPLGSTSLNYGCYGYLVIDENVDPSIVDIIRVGEGATTQGITTCQKYHSLYHIHDRPIF
jgi:hypothetical protein